MITSVSPFLHEVAQPLLISASETIDGKLRPNAQRQRNGHNWRTYRKPPSHFRMVPQLTIYLYSAHRAVIFAIAQLSCFIELPRILVLESSTHEYSSPKCSRFFLLLEHWINSISGVKFSDCNFTQSIYCAWCTILRTRPSSIFLSSRCYELLALPASPTKVFTL